MSDSSNSSALIAYEKIANPIEAMGSLGKSIANSGFFGCTSVEQGNVIALECIVRGIPPMLMAQQFHIIGGKLSMKADAMLAEFRRIGGLHKVIARTPEIATIELTHEGDTQRFTFSWEEAKLEPFAYNGQRETVLAAIASGKTDKLTLNPNYASPRKRMQMLWARVVSDGIRTLAPEVNFGRYAPEDLDDADDERPAAGVQEAKAGTNGNGKSKKPTTPKTPEAAQPVEGEIDAEFEVVADSTPQKSKLMEAIRSHWRQLGATLDDQAAMVGKERCGRPGAAALVGLDIDQLTDLEAKLRGAVDKAAEVAREAEEVPFDIDEEPTGPISDIQIAAAKELIIKLQATEPLITDTIKEQLKIIGKAKLSELSAVQANVLISDLKKGDTKLSGAAMYFQESLQPVPHYATEAGN